MQSGIYLRAPAGCLASAMDDDASLSLSYAPRAIPLGSDMNMKVCVLAPWLDSNSKHMWQIRDFFLLLQKHVPQRIDEQIQVKGTKKRRLNWKHKGESWFVNKYEHRLQEHLQCIYPDVYDDNGDSSKMIPCVECSERKTGRQTRKARSGCTGIPFSEIWQCKLSEGP